jgi:hypothetical protein
MFRAVVCVVSVMLLAACGGQKPWQIKPKAGLWKQTDLVGGGVSGPNIAICYAEGRKLNLYPDEQASDPAQGRSCDPAKRTATGDGWSSSQACKAGGRDFVVHYDAHGDPASGMTTQLSITDPGGAPLKPAQSLRVERVGDCPRGWKPADYVELNPADGQFRLVHPADNGMDTFETLASLPPELSASTGR